MMPEATGASGPFLIRHPDGWAEVILDDPTRSVNILTVAVMEGLEALVASFHSLAGDGALRGVVFRSGKAQSFLAGADLEAMNGITEAAEAEAVARRGQALFQSIADLAVPTVAVIHGPCVGGGTELALACDLRILSDDPRTALSLPEVRLGIVPAWGGTTRLPPLVGILPALPILLTGRAVRAREALAMGLGDAVLPAAALSEDPMAAARHPAVLRRGGVRRWIHRIPGARRLILGQARRSVLRETGGAAPAPLAILDLLKETGGRQDPATIARGLALEAKALGRLLVSPESRGLRHLFGLQQAARRPLDGGDPIAREALPGLFLEAPAPGAVPPGSGAALLREGQKRGLRVETGPLHCLDDLPGGRTQWILAAAPEGVASTAARTPPPWQSRLVGLGRPEGVTRGPLLELVAPSLDGTAEAEATTLLREAHALALALGGIPILVRGPEGRLSAMIQALSRNPVRDPEANAGRQLAVALEALESGAFQGAGSIDLAMVLAGMAPPWRGGPLYEAHDASGTWHPYGSGISS